MPFREINSKMIEATVVPGHDPEVTRRFPAVAGAPEGVALRLA